VAIGVCYEPSARGGLFGAIISAKKLPENFSKISRIVLQLVPPGRWQLCFGMCAGGFLSGPGNIGGKYLKPLGGAFHPETQVYRSSSVLAAKITTKFKATDLSREWRN